MSLSRNQRGSSYLVLFVAVAVIAIVGAVGYNVVHTNNLADTSSAGFHSSSVPSSIKNTADVQRADKALDSTTIDSPDQLDSDLNAL